MGCLCLDQGRSEPQIYDKDGIKMNSRKTLLFSAALIGFVSISLYGQQKLIDRKEEAQRFAELQKTERIQDKNIISSNQMLAGFGHLVEQARTDRLVKWQEVNVDAMSFENTFRLLKFTPRNTYIRYVEDIEDLKKDKDGKIKGNFILAGFGDMQEIQQEMEKEVKLAKNIGVDAKAIQFNRGRVGIELIQFDFIYAEDRDARRAVGSKRKGLSLYFTKGKDGAMNLDMVVIRVIDDHMRNGLRNLQVIIDPTPLDDQLDDILIFDRYNQKPTKVTVLGMMKNTPTSSHRLEFKQKFYQKLLTHFYRLYRMVDAYSTTGAEGYNESVLKKLEDSLTY